MNKYVLMHCLVTFDLWLFPGPDAPTDLHFSEVTEDTVLVVWSAPQSHITGYRLFITAEDSTPLKQLRVRPEDTQFTVQDLQPDTQYTITLHSEQGNTLSEGVSGTVTTCEFTTKLTQMQGAAM